MVIYSSDNYIDVDSDSEVAIAEMTTLDSLILNWTTLQPYMEFDVEQRTSIQGIYRSKKNYYQTYTITLFGFEVEEQNDYDDFVKLQDILSKKYIFLNASDYFHSVHKLNYVIACDLLEAPSIENSGRWIDFSFKLRKLVG